MANPVGRPTLEIDGELVEKLASIMCTQQEIATIVGCSVDTLQNNYSARIKEGMNRGRMSLRRQQFQKAMEGHPTMLIWLGKNYLGQKDQVQVDHAMVEPLKIIRPINGTVEVIAPKAVILDTQS